MPTHLNRPLALALSLALPAVPLAAQGSTSVPSLSLQVQAGVSQYDYSGTGTAFHLAARLVRPFSTYLLGEVGLGYTRYSLDNSTEEVQHLIPELQVQVQYPFGRVAPYVGVGGGGSLVWISDANDFEPTLSAALGARVGVASTVSLVGELRVRGTGGGFEGAAAEWTVGVGWRPW